jgi:hypothetical protein
VTIPTDEFSAQAIADRKLLRHVPADDIPDSADMLSARALEDYLHALGSSGLSLLVLGDIMLGGRARKVVADQGPDYPFAATLPLLRRASLVVANLEGPLAQRAKKQERTWAYRMKPALAAALRRAGIGTVNLANNHLLDCGREGVLETLAALTEAEVAALGAGMTEAAAHVPVIRQAGPYRIGLLGYYWNRRCAATATLPGCALDSTAALEADICNLRGNADRIVVMYHWGVPYVREPAPPDRAKARLAIDCGADAVIGHHPHIVQPLELYRGRPIFYSIGNFMLGSGNSRAEGLALGLTFEDRRTLVEVWPLYVKNRDPRVHYQPKVLGGAGAQRVLRRLADMSGSDGKTLRLEEGRGILKLGRG